MAQQMKSASGKQSSRQKAVSQGNLVNNGSTLKQTKDSSHPPKSSARSKAPKSATKKKLPPKLKSMGNKVDNPYNQDVLVPKNQENEALSMTNLFKRVKSIEKNKSDNDIQIQGKVGPSSMTPSILRKGSAYTNPPQGNKSVRINESQNSQHDKNKNGNSQLNYQPKLNQEQQQEQQFENEVGNEDKQNEFYMGYNIPSLTTEVHGQYIQQSRDAERKYYEESLRPDKIKGNIESHRRNRSDGVQGLPDQISGIKIMSDDVPQQDQIQYQKDQKQKNSNSKATSEFEYDENEMSRYTNFLFNKNLVNKDEEGGDQVEENIMFPEQDDHMSMLLEEKPQYMLKEKIPGEEASFKDYMYKESEEMKDQLNNISRIIQENERRADEFLYKSNDNETKEIIEFNRSFQKNLKHIEDLFEDDKRKIVAPAKQTVNISLLEKEDTQFGGDTSKHNRSGRGLPKALQSMIEQESVHQVPQKLGNNGFEIGSYEDEEQDEQNQINQQFIQQQVPQNQERQVRKQYSLQMNKQPQQFHLLNYLMSDKNSPPIEGSSLNDMDFNQAAKDAADNQSEFSQAEGLSQQTPHHFSKVIKGHLLSNQTPQNRMNQNQYRPGSITPTNQIQRQRTQTKDQPRKNKKPPLPIYQQQQKRLADAYRNLSDPEQVTNPRQYQQAETQSVRSNAESEVNVFSENSQINEGQPPAQIFNPYFKVETTANKIYNKNDPFLINMTLRQKLTETNQMIYVDNQNLLEKIKKLGKSIKPVKYGLPYIDLTQKDALQSEQQDAQFQSQVYAASIKNSMQEYFGDSNTQNRQLNDPTYQIFQNDSLYQTYPEQQYQQIMSNQQLANVQNPFYRQESFENEPNTRDQASKYLHFNFNGLSGLQLKQKMNAQRQKQQNITLEDQKIAKDKRIQKFAQNYRNNFVTEVVNDKIQEEAMPTTIKLLSSGAAPQSSNYSGNQTLKENQVSLQHQQITSNFSPLDQFQNESQKFQNNISGQSILPEKKKQTLVYPQQNIIINMHEGTPQTVKYPNNSAFQENIMPNIKTEMIGGIGIEEADDRQNLPSPLQFLNITGNLKPSHIRILSQPEKQQTSIVRPYHQQFTANNLKSQHTYSLQNNHSNQQDYLFGQGEQEEIKDDDIIIPHKKPALQILSAQDSFKTEKTGVNKSPYPQSSKNLSNLTPHKLPIDHQKQKTNQSLFKVKTTIEGQKNQNFQKEENQMTYMKLATTNDPDFQFDSGTPIQDKNLLSLNAHQQPVQHFSFKVYDEQALEMDNGTQGRQTAQTISRDDFDTDDGKDHLNFQDEVF